MLMHKLKIFVRDAAITSALSRKNLALSPNSVPSVHGVRTAVGTAVCCLDIGFRHMTTVPLGTLVAT